MATTQQDLIDIKELIDYWMIRKDTADKMVASLLREEKVIKESLGR